MSEQADRDELVEVLAGVIPHANWCDYDEKTAEGCQPGFGCNVHAERAHIAEVVLDSGWLAQRDRQVAAEALREAAEEIDSVGHHWSGAPALAFFALAGDLRERADRIEAES